MVEIDPTQNLPNRAEALRPEPVVAVYTQGKVASKSMVNTLQEMFPERHIWDVRRGTMEGVIEHETIRGTRPSLLSEDRQFAQFLIENPTVDLKLVSIVREPVAIALSSFFYNFIPRNPGVDINEISDDEIIARLIKGESFSSPSFHLDWFDIEVKPLTSIDVYNDGIFPVERGYDEYFASTGLRQSELLVIRLEDLSKVGSVALSGFFGTTAPEIMSQKNVGAEADYGARYTTFKQKARLPEEWVEWQLGSKYAKYFYTPSELVQFAEQWVG